MDSRDKKKLKFAHWHSHTFYEVYIFKTVTTIWEARHVRSVRGAVTHTYQQILVSCTTQDHMAGLVSQSCYILFSILPRLYHIVGISLNILLQELATYYTAFVITE